MDSRSSNLSRVFAKRRKKPSGSIDQGGIDGSSQWSEYPIISEHSETVEPDYHGESSQFLFSSGYSVEPNLYSINQSHVSEGEGHVLSDSCMTQTYDTMEDIVSHAWGHNGHKTRAYREGVIQKKLGLQSHRRFEESRRMTNSQTASFQKSSTNERKGASWLLWFIEKIVGLSGQPQKTNIVADVIYLFLIVVTIGYFFLCAVFITIEIREEQKQSDVNVWEKLKEILINQFKFLWKASLCIVFRNELRKLINDDLMVRTLLKHVKMLTPLPFVAILLGFASTTLDIFIDLRTNFLKLYSNVHVASYAEPTLLTFRTITSVLSITWSNLLLVLLGAWCNYLSDTIKLMFRDLDEDAVICEYNFFIHQQQKQLHQQQRIRPQRNEYSTGIRDIHNHNAINVTNRSSYLRDREEVGQLHSRHSPTPDRGGGGGGGGALREGGGGVCQTCDEIEILTNEQLLLMYTQLRERLVYTSTSFETWLGLNLLSGCLNSVLFLLRYVTDGAELDVIARQALIMGYLPVLVQNVLRVNSQLGNLPKHIYPLPTRASVFTLINASKAELCIFGRPLTYGSVCAVFLAICVGLTTRLLVQL
ncbi:uncharacterized protein LOC134846806 [Symsagittifera roscoffensis]|uniref:uncharacterized protein LOC134846806 n=1 Tax=Symsagittifera roscoffensis TaxID=84072 RepID=UPI00307BD6A7